MEREMDYYDINKIDDFIESVAEAALQVPRLISRDSTPKWALIAMHASVQGAMVLALDQGNGFASMKKNDLKKWQVAVDNVKVGKADSYPDTQMEYFLDLYEKVKTKSYMRNDGAEPFVPGDHDFFIEQLNRLRNNFVHFHAGIFVIEKSLARNCLLKAAEVTSFLIDGPVFPWPHRNDALSERQAVLRDLKSIVDCLTVSKEKSPQSKPLSQL